MPRLVTTIRPQIGTVSYTDLRTITIADLPGLIEGAHANYGLGHKFLKHIERTRLLLLMVDIFGFRLSPKHPHRNCMENIYALNKELELYNPSLLEKPSVLLVNKMDCPEAAELLQGIKSNIENLEIGLAQCPDEIRPHKLMKFKSIIPISAKNSARVNEVKRDLRLVLDKLAEELFVENEETIVEKLKFKVGERGPKVT